MVEILKLSQQSQKTGANKGFAILGVYIAIADLQYLQL